METNFTERSTKEDKQLQLPKNIRQIGNVQGSVRIYMEDYVYTYLHGSGRASWTYRGSIFVGTRCQENGQKYLFVSGLVHIPEDCFHEGVPTFSDLMWGSVYQEIKCFYDQVEILGWGMDVAGASAKLTGNLEQIHRRAFPGQEKFAFLMDSLEKEEAFYIYEKNMLRRRDGYYVYYEKNPQMQEYMMQGRAEEEVEPEIDPQQAVVVNCRKLSAKKKKKGGKFVYAACLGLLAAVAAMGVNMISSAGKIQKLEETVSFLKTDDTRVESDTLPVNATDVEFQETLRAELRDAQDEQVAKEENTAAAEENAQSLQKEETEASEEDAQTEQSQKKKKKKQSENAQAADEDAEQKTNKDKKETIKKEDAEQKAEQTADTQETAALAEQKYYIVKAGESLIGISRKLYGEDCTKQLCERNELEDGNKIYAGQKLLLLDK